MYPIGTFYGDAVYKYDAPRQGRLFAGHPGQIRLQSGMNFETALRDLEGFERIWVIFCFHENSGWRPTTRPPVPAIGKERIGTFASRSPYRPNPIGLSCVRLLKIEGLTLYVDEADLLNETPIIDIKPYIPMADAFPNAKAGWVDDQNLELWEIGFSELFKEQNEWLYKKAGYDLKSFAQIQLAQGPKDTSRRRITLNPPNGTLSYRTFRMDFEFDEIKKSVFLKSIYSGYSPEEIDSPDDPYGDKQIHYQFTIQYKN
ncbi:MAG: tRNA (N6-threonylcarbamoyladenosine(37)-N6)-methyltransferase TrmO [Fibrobacter sp.]|nr:tRNA (N6-threonylcarbamoyladenosine(37)-N6)-methyltransferase TrmO [Fibrobacter sp.]